MIQASDRDLTVVFATHGRTATLRRTLEAMCRLDCAGIDVEFIVVNNNSPDETAEILESYRERLPMQILLEKRPGKNSCLNRVLDDVPLAPLILFTDNDVVPCERWLHEIVEGAARWPEHDFFGGRIDPVWPEDCERPFWEHDRYLSDIVLATHDMGEEREYVAPEFPFGPNFAVRRRVFEQGFRFDPNIGPQAGKNYRMGAETALFVELDNAGLKAAYLPNACVGHEVQKKLLPDHAVIGRFYRQGIGHPHYFGIDHPERLEQNPHLWLALRRFSIIKSQLKCLLGRLIPNRQKRLMYLLQAHRWLGFNRECLAIGKEKLRDK